eukprot:CAMPEP_0118924862 /NCGR_PEP_ID=MMETSP1169-20130426/2799_1 /TAXON_ID=36882 /ORGANISM="Pyramimonas obovata, Strain CCMP722" /LENGTH=355 /DNA_ID=CAMNT_0006866001 /DNA_START=207 /DNA_END=1274 /DNA_ORIENTATION=+
MRVQCSSKLRRFSLRVSAPCGQRPRLQRCVVRSQAQNSEENSSSDNGNYNIGTYFKRSYKVAPWVVDGKGLAVATVGLAVLGADLMGPQLLANGPDMAIHTYVKTHSTTEQLLWWDREGSNWPYIASIAGSSVVLLAALLSKNNGKAFRAAVLSQIAFSNCAASVVSSDPALTNALKSFFHRARPSTLHSTFSFPSGHTTASAFLAGMLIWVVLPLVLGPNACDSDVDASEESSTNQPAEERQLEQLIGPGGAYLQMAVWGGLVSWTAAGRMLADVHWLSDTMAGACLGFGVASALAMSLGFVEETWQDKVTPALKGIGAGGKDETPAVTPIVEPTETTSAKEKTEARSDVKSKV